MAKKDARRTQTEQARGFDVLLARLDQRRAARGARVIRPLHGGQRGDDLADALTEQPEVKPIGLGARDSLRLEAGQQVTFDRDAVSAIGLLPAESAAWVQGMLSVNDWPLGDFIEELGRYRPGVLRCDPAVQGLSISGAFRIDDTDTVLENLSKTLPVKVRYVTRYWANIEPV
mgnify:CR=1 FL=1